ncbi:hypothetical protein V8C26DRAFT_94269 [Trichoderma gracile]
MTRFRLCMVHWSKDDQMLRPEVMIHAVSSSRTRHIKHPHPYHWGYLEAPSYSCGLSTATIPRKQVGSKGAGRSTTLIDPNSQVIMPHSLRSKQYHVEERRSLCTTDLSWPIRAQEVARRAGQGRHSGSPCLFTHFTGGRWATIRLTRSWHQTGARQIHCS